MTTQKMMLFFCLAGGIFLASLPHIIWLLGWCISKPFGHPLRYAPFGWASLALVLVFWLAMAYGYFIGRFKTEVTHMDYSNAAVPAEFEGFRIVHISDFHLSTFDDKPEAVQHIVDLINEQKPDLVCFTGDLVTMGVAEAQPYAGALRGIAAEHGVVSVLGNHDFLIYERSFRDNEPARLAEVERLAAFERDSLGWQLLRNSSKVIAAPGGASIAILGVDNKNCSNQGFQTIDCGNLPAALEGCEPAFKVLLSHDPSHWTAETVPDTDIQLTLSGHTHAAQIRLFGWNPSKLMFEQTDGRYDLDGQTLYVNIGLGCTAPFRIGAPSEITVITLHHE